MGYIRGQNRKLYYVCKGPECLKIKIKKIKAWQNIMRQRASKDAIELLLCWSSAVEHRACI